MQRYENSNFAQLNAEIRDRLPMGYLFGIVGSYLVNAALFTFFLLPILNKMFGPAAPWMAIPGAFIVQYFRFLIVFTDQLLPGTRSAALLVNLVALAMTVWGVAEVYHLVSAFDLTKSEFWGVFGFAASIILAGYVLEISFVRKSNELATLGRQSPTLPSTAYQGNRHRPTGAAMPEEIDLEAILGSQNGNGHQGHR